MPADHGRRLHQNEDIPPPGPGTSQEHPERAVEGAQPWPRASTVEHRELLPKSEVLGDEREARNQERAEGCEDQREHARACLRRSPNVHALSEIDVLARDRDAPCHALQVRVVKLADRRSRSLGSGGTGWFPSFTIPNRKK